MYGGIINLTNTSSNPYFTINKTVNLYENSLINVGGGNSISVTNGAKLNFLGGAVSATTIRVNGASTGGKLYLGTENAISDCSVQIDGEKSTAGSILNIETADVSQTIKQLNIGVSREKVNNVVVAKHGSTTNILLSATKDVAEYFQITKFYSYNGIKSFTAYMNIENFANDFVVVDSNLTLDSNNNLYLSSLDMTIELTAYLGTKDGKAIKGTWSLVKDEWTGLQFLNNSAVPEPSTFAAIFGAIALGLAIRRRK